MFYKHPLKKDVKCVSQLFMKSWFVRNKTGFNTELFVEWLQYCWIDLKAKWTSPISLTT